MALSDAVKEIKLLLEAISGIGKVTEYLVYREDEAGIKATYTLNGLLHCWIITREGSRNTDIGPQATLVRHRLAIHGYRAIESESDSEVKHQDMTELVRAKIDANRTLANSAGVVQSPAQVETVNTGLFAGRILCWHTKITVEVGERFLGS